MKLLHSGSVKDIYQIDSQSNSNPEIITEQLLFRFSNRYSIYDWGEMPDSIPGKGAALCLMGKKILQELKSRGFSTHYLAPGHQPEDFIVQSVTVPRSETAATNYTPDIYQNQPVNTLVPLEVIFRFGAPKGSSLLRKLKSKADWLAAGFDRQYHEGEFFNEVKLDYTTKLERLDRVLTGLEAQKLSGMSDTEWSRLNELTLRLADELKKIFEHSKMTLWDGKFEFAFIAGSNTQSNTDRDFMLVDSVGLDEMRLTYHGHPLSKELLRQCYVHSDWVKNLEQSKKDTSTDFKSRCINFYQSKPQPLSQQQLKAIQTVYQVTADLILNTNSAECENLHQQLYNAICTMNSSSTAELPKSVKKSVLVLGSGGREHALAWKLRNDFDANPSDTHSDVWVWPGNPGMFARHSKIKILEVENQNSEDLFSKLVKAIHQHQIGWVVIGPEKYLYEGWVDQFRACDIPVLGPTKAASFLESSKIKSKQFMKKYGIPTSDFVASTDFSTALQNLKARQNRLGWVLKLSGPALGKGVVVTQKYDVAENTIHEFYQHQPAGIEDGVLIEDLAPGEEVSIFYLCKNESFQFLASACDHKRLLDQDQGPNTGGMGAFSPATFVNEAFLRRVEKEIVQPTLTGMIQEGTPFTGVLFLGLMVERQDALPIEDPKTKINLLEYNVRFGDPETQTFLPLLSNNFAETLWITANSTNYTLKTQNPIRTIGKSIHIVKAAKGYPGLYGQAIESGKKIQFENSISENCTVFFAGVANNQNNQLVTSGGRVLGVTAVADTFKLARQSADQAVKKVHFENEHYRRDIGERAIESSRIQVALFASGTGTNVIQLIKSARNLNRISIACVIIDQPSSPLIHHLKTEFKDIPVHVIPINSKLPAHQRKDDHETQILQALIQHQVDWCFLAGYMRIFSKNFLNHFSRPNAPDRVVNLHPSRLPLHPGKSAYEDAFQSPETDSAVTVHFVDAGIDTGPIIEQRPFPKLPTDTFESFRRRGREIEWKLYPEILARLNQDGTL
jgi:phosphoribosylamine--glycine ligase